MKKYISEFIGTFALVFCGTGAIIIDQETGGVISHAGVAATFGLIVMCMIYTFGEISGAHINPAVTIGFALSGRFDKKEVLPYAGSQMQSFILEIILTYLLMLVILNVSQGSKETGLFAGIAVGGTVLLEAMFAGPICGASMNPARSMAPAFVSGNFTALWVYIAAPVLGVGLATLTWKVLKQ